MSRVHSRDTKPEWVVRRLLFGMGYRYRLHDRRLPGSPDLTFPVRHKVIWVHGCFWHGHDCKNGVRLPKSNRDFWEHKKQQNAERDKRALEAITALGWETLVIWECEVHSPSLAARLREYLGEPRL